MADALYSTGDISVDTNFARFGEKSYAMDILNSVEIKKIVATQTARTVFAGLAGLGLIGMIFDPSIVKGLFVLAMGGCAYWAHQNPNKDTYRLY